MKIAVKKGYYTDTENYLNKEYFGGDILRVKSFVVFLLISSLFLLVMAGCSGDSVQAKQLYLDSVDALMQANSYSFDITIDQAIHFPEPIPFMPGEETDKLATQVSVTGRGIEDPLALVMTMKVSMPDFMDLDGMSDMQFYMVDNEAYMYLNMFKEWWYFDEYSIDRKSV